MYEPLVTEEGQKVYDRILEEINADRFDGNDDIQIFSPIGLVLGEMGGFPDIEEATFECLVEAIKKQMEYEFEHTEFTGNLLKAEWFSFKETAN